MKRGVERRHRWWIAVLLLAALAVAPAALADKPVADTVYDGQYPATQANGSWGAIPVQFEVSGDGRQVREIVDLVTMCAPASRITLEPAAIRNGSFRSFTSLPDYQVEITGTFEADGKAKGEGILNTVDVTGAPCRVVGHWDAKALPKGTDLCPGISNTAPDVTVTDMTCHQAAEAYQAGLDDKANPDPNAFETPGFDCRSGKDDPVVRYVCTDGKKVFRIPG